MTRVIGVVILICIVAGLITRCAGGPKQKATQVASDNQLADSLADNLAVVFAEAASRDATGITASDGTEIHVHMHDMKDFEFRRLHDGLLEGIRLWMAKHGAELNQTKVRKICVNNGPLMGLSACVSR